MGEPTLRHALTATLAALRRAMAAERRLEAGRARTDTRAWVMKRRERTRHLIELGGLVVKAKLPDLTDDDRAVLYGALLTLAIMLGGDQRDEMLALWRRRGRRAFGSEADVRAYERSDSG